MQYLSKRLSKIHDMVNSDVLMDVGSDHGKLIISLIKDKKIRFGYAVENKKGPYTRLVDNIKKENLLDSIKPLLSDGITLLSDDIDTVVIAGMGGYNILKILNAHKEKLNNVKHIIVDAHNAINEVRRGITNLGFSIYEENILKEDDIYYEIIDFIKSDVHQYNEDEYDFGPILLKKKDECFKEKWNERIKEIDNILINDNVPEKRKGCLKQEKERILKWKNCSSS